MEKKLEIFVMRSKISGLNYDLLKFYNVIAYTYFEIDDLIYNIYYNEKKNSVFIDLMIENIVNRDIVFIKKILGNKTDEFLEIIENYIFGSNDKNIIKKEKNIYFFENISNKRCTNNFKSKEDYICEIETFLNKYNRNQLIPMLK